MIISDKIELVRLLELYQQEQLDLNNENLKKYNQAVKYNVNKYSVNYAQGIKARYNHARIIKAKLEKEINQNLWTL